jgi:hypothetical protein
MFLFLLSTRQKQVANNARSFFADFSDFFRWLNGRKSISEIPEIGAGEAMLRACLFSC